MNPKISIITIRYNHKESLEKTLKSVVSQDYKDFEYVVIDGGSTDGSKELLEKYSDKITSWVSEPDNGIYHALNKGILSATGDYLFFLNAGDLFIDESSLSLAAKEVHTEDIIYFNIEVKGENVNFVKECPSVLSFYFFYKDTLPHQATFMSAKSFKMNGLYDESLKIVADWKWYFEAICFKNLTYKKVNEKFSTFFLDGISSLNSEKVIAERNKVLFTLPSVFTTDALEMDALKSELKELQHFQRSYQHLKKYRLVKLLHQLKLINIPD